MASLSSLKGCGICYRETSLPTRDPTFRPPRPSSELLMIMRKMNRIRGMHWKITMIGIVNSYPCPQVLNFASNYRSGLMIFPSKGFGREKRRKATAAAAGGRVAIERDMKGKDWECLSCFNLNWSWRGTCNKCGATKLVNSSTVSDFALLKSCCLYTLTIIEVSPLYRLTMKYAMVLDAGSMSDRTVYQPPRWRSMKRASTTSADE